MRRTDHLCSTSPAPVTCPARRLLTPCLVAGQGAVWVVIQILLQAPLLIPTAAVAQARVQKPDPAQTQGRNQFTLQRAVGDPTLLEYLPETQWIPGTRTYSKIDPLRRQRVKVIGLGEGATERPLFSVAQLAPAMAKAGVTMDRRARIPPFTWQDATTVRIQQPDGVYLWKVGDADAHRALPLPAGAAPLAIAKDDSRVAYVKDHQLFVQVGDAAPMQLSQDGSADIVYGGPAHRSEFGIKDGLWWSPEGRFLAFFREDMTPIGIYPYVDHTAMPPKAIHGRYPMAGQIHSAVRVGVYDTQNGELHYLQHGTEPDVYWTNVTFDPSGTALYVAIVNRGQDTMELVGFDAATGKHQGVLFTESDPQWIEPEHGPIFVGNRADRFLWFSPRDGYRHLYLYTRKGELVRQVTTGKFDVHEFLTFDPGAAHAFCMASGSNPLQMHLWRAKLADGSMQQLTKARGWHTCQVRDGGDLVVDSVSNLDLPGQQQVIDIATGNTANVVRIGHRFPVLGKQEFFEVAAEDGTPLHGMLILPPELDRAAARKYPALLYVYGGPHSHLVRDRFLGGSSPWLHWMATQGYVVCTLDNRGTENRGIEFAQSIHRRLAQLETRDQLAAIDHLAGLPYVDTERIGVHGWSYGGYMTLNLMLRAPGRFKCGVAGAPVTDWRQYETGYTERYLDTPQENPEGYQAASVLPLVGDLRDRLLIIHGTDDKTVMWSHTLAFVNQCIGAGTLVDYMPYPMQQHGIRGIGPRLHLYRLMTRHFADHLQPGR